jgi:crotonobetainyl-CoA:carnitine CoA-transferase CaiB-like acyl-CoA transferase
MDEVPEHPQHRARGMFFTQQDPQHGPLRLLRLPLDELRATAPPPAQGEHTDELLAEIGLSAEELARLRQTRVIR